MSPAMIALILQLLQAEATMLPSEIAAVQTIISAISGHASVVPNATLTANDTEIQSLLSQLKTKAASPVPVATVGSTATAPA